MCELGEEQLEKISLESLEAKAMEHAECHVATKYWRPNTKGPWDLESAPLHLEEAKARPDSGLWQTAMTTELDAINSNGVFKESTLPPNRKALGL